MPDGDLRQLPLDIVTACRAVDLPILALAHRSLRQFVPFRTLHVLTAGAHFERFRRILGPDVALLDEDQVIPGMSLAALRSLPLPGFPGGAGWYFQQLLKFGFAFREPEREHYLIWDADTVALRPLEFFDAEGRMLLTAAEEAHAPYFDTYRHLLGEEPNRECSFISQHLIVRKAFLREMLQQIEERFPGPDSWAWKIMRNLRGTSTNLFSEYEMLGHFVKNHHPDSMAIRRLEWLREGSSAVRGIPSDTDLRKLAERFHFAAFESSHRPLRKLMRSIKALFRR